MEPQRVDPITGVLNMLKCMASGISNRDTSITTKVGNITVDTCLTYDSNLWETGIDRPDVEGRWVIVEQYENEEHAKTGHQAWVDTMTEYPDYPLKDIDQWSLNQ